MLCLSVIYISHWVRQTGVHLVSILYESCYTKYLPNSGASLTYSILAKSITNSILIILGLLCSKQSQSNTGSKYDTLPNLCGHFLTLHPHIVVPISATDTIEIQSCNYSKFVLNPFTGNNTFKHWAGTISCGQ